MPDGTYRLDTDKPSASRAERLLLRGVRYMCVSEDTVCAPGEIAALKMSNEGKVKSFQRKYPWLDKEEEKEDTSKTQLA